MNHQHTEGASGLQRGGSERDLLPQIVMCLIMALIVIVVVNVLFFRTSSEIVIQAADSAANFNAVSAVAQGERLARSAEWTIASILTLGSALVGLNWYVAGRNYTDEQQRIRREEEGAQQRLSKIESELVGSANDLKADQQALRGELEDRIRMSNLQIAELYQQVSDSVAQTVLLGHTANQYSGQPTANLDRIDGSLAILAVSLNAMSGLHKSDKVLEVYRQIVRTHIANYRWIETTFIGSQYDVSPYAWFLVNEIRKSLSIPGLVDLLGEWDRWASRLRLKPTDIDG